MSENQLPIVQVELARPTSYFDDNTVEDLYRKIQEIYLSDNRPWVIGYSGGKDSTATLQIIFHSTESLTNALTNVAAFGLYTVAGLLLLPAIFTTAHYPRWLAWLGSVEWGIAAFATMLLVIAPALATVPLLISFALYAPWVWGSAIWLYRTK